MRQVFGVRYIRAIVVFGFLLGLIVISPKLVDGQWTPVGSYNTAHGDFNNITTSFTKDQSGNLYAAGWFENCNGKKYVAKWNGSGWSELGGTNASTFNYFISTLTTDAGGNVYAAGGFTNSNGKFYVAKWNGSGWSELGGTNASTFDYGINSITTDSGGNVYAAGWFGNGNGKYYVAKWNGSTWSELGGINASTFNGTYGIQTLTTDVGGNVYAAGGFTNSNGKFYVAKWNGSGWSELGGTNTSKFFGTYGINTLTTDAGGNVYAAGWFTNSNGKHYVAKWNGSGWSELGGTNNSTFSSYINTLTTDAGGNVYVAGNFKNGNGKFYVAKWNGSDWSELGGTIAASFYSSYGIQTLTTDGGGNVYAAGYFRNGIGKFYVAKWYGSGWSELGGTNNSTFINSISTLTADASGNMYAACNFTDVNGKYYVTKWNGSSWSKLGGINAFTFDSSIVTLTTDAGGNLYAAGEFRNGNKKQYVAQWNGSGWSELGGTNASTFNWRINTLTTDAGGNVYAAGGFSNGNGKQYVAKWNGSGWSELGGTNASAFNNSILTLTTDNVGNVYAAGYFSNGNGKFYVAKWNGSGWSELGGTNASTFNSYIHTLTTDAGGNVYTAGWFSNGNGKWYVAKWNGSGWSELGGTNASTFYGHYGIKTLTTDAGGNVYAAGDFTNSNGKCYVAKWNGSGWSELGGTNASTFNGGIMGGISTLTTDAGGTVYAGGYFTLNVPNYTTNYVAKYTNPTATPVTLTTLTAKPTETQEVALAWQTATETNSSHFIIERSTDGKAFISIGKVKAIGTGANAYHFNDQKPPLGKETYYRLKMIDKDGSFEYSKVVSVSLFTHHSPLITISPNPAKDKVRITIQINKAENGVLQIINTAGKVVKQQKVSLREGLNQINVSINFLAKGNYIVSLKTESNQYQEQFIKE